MMPRDRSTAQPHRKLSEEEWEALRLQVETQKTVSVETLCGRWGVSKQRFYRKFPAGQRPGAPSALPRDESEAA